jgi:flagellar FliL protein
MGVGAGAFVGAPMLTRRGADASAPSAPAAKPADGEAHGEVLGGPMHVLDNMVLNPAESGASRFLLVSVALQLKNEGALSTLKAKDAALRDRVLRILGAHRVEELSDMRQRDALRTRIRLAVDSLAGGEAVTAVYFPQFVIQ